MSLSLSVIMPSYGHARCIEGALLDFLESPRPPDEVIVVDDCSSDGSYELVEGLTYAHSRLRQLRNEVNQGVVLSARRGFQASQGDLVMFAAADDRRYPGFLPQSLAWWEEFPAAGLSCTHHRLHRPGHFEDNVSGRCDHSLREGWWSAADLQGVTMGFTGASVIYRREAYLGAGGLLPELQSACDWVLSVVVGHRQGVLYNPRELVSCCVHGGTYSGSRPPRAQADLAGALDDVIMGRDYADVQEALIRYRAATRSR